MKRILLLGEFGSGKSAFVNMLLGYPILPENLISTDLPIVRIYNGLTSNISYTRTDNHRIRINSWSEIPSDWTTLKAVNISVKNHPILSKKVVIYDTPGINIAKPDHLIHLENFLESNSKDYDIVLFFLPDKISKTAINFISKWKSIRKHLQIIINIKDGKSVEQCKQIKNYIERTVFTVLGPIQVHLLSIGTLYKMFFEKYKSAADWKVLNDWQVKINFFQTLIQDNIDSIIGANTLKIIWEIIERKDKKIASYGALSAEILDEMVEFRDYDAMAEKANRLLNKGMCDQALMLLAEPIQADNAEAQAILEIIYQLGYGGIEHDYLEGPKWFGWAFKLFRKATEQNDAKAQNSMGYMYLYGKGVEKDYTEALKWYKKSAEQNDAESQFRMGDMYLYGDGVEKNYTEALKWYKKSAEQNYLRAYHNIAAMYENALGVEQNFSEVVKWYRKAAEQDDADAQEWLDNLKEWLETC